MSEVNIKVEIAGSIFPLKVNAEDEQNIKEAVDLINNKIVEFEKNYAIKDKKDVLGMVMLQLVSQLYKQANNAEKELSHLKLLFADVEEMLKEHQQNINTIEEE
ncbi:cell division protein ZapA [Aurantibacillus circumpalustris]|uniref:cell division protein ZapA n=1 Tax=Aurantibacillus circumpalustris TaxID=3036359 RepID=UPI00295AE768|nr:cell division protein ZapA [Aurantibacillus circumpalustris]